MTVKNFRSEDFTEVALGFGDDEFNGGVRVTGVAGVDENVFVVGDVSGNLFFINGERKIPGKRHQTSKGVTALTVQRIADGERLLATGHEDGKVAVFRISDDLELELVASWKSHVRMISSIVWHPSRVGLLASTGLDGAVKLFDIRAEFALQAATVEDKLSAAKWLNDTEIVVGGSSGQLRTVKFASL